MCSAALDGNRPLVRYPSIYTKFLLPMIQKEMVATRVGPDNGVIYCRLLVSRPGHHHHHMRRIPHPSSDNFYTLPFVMLSP